MSIVKEFKEFAIKGNVVDMAIGIIIGGAFGKIVTSFVNDIIMPPLGLLLGSVGFSEFKWTLKPAAMSEAGEIVTEAVSLNWGMFLQTALDFVIVAAAIFIAIKMMNKLRREEPVEETPATPPADIQLLTEIRDELRKN